MLRSICRPKASEHMRRLMERGKIGLMGTSEQGFAETRAKAKGPSQRKASKGRMEQHQKATEGRTRQKLRTAK